MKLIHKLYSFCTPLPPFCLDQPVNNILYHSREREEAISSSHHFLILHESDTERNAFSKSVEGERWLRKCGPGRWLVLSDVTTLLHMNRGWWAVTFPFNFWHALVLSTMCGVTEAQTRMRVAHTPWHIEQSCINNILNWRVRQDVGCQRERYRQRERFSTTYMQQGLSCVKRKTTTIAQAGNEAICTSK